MTAGMCLGRQRCRAHLLRALSSILAALLVPMVPPTKISLPAHSSATTPQVAQAPKSVPAQLTAEPRTPPAQKNKVFVPHPSDYKGGDEPADLDNMVRRPPTRQNETENKAMQSADCEKRSLLSRLKQIFPLSVMMTSLKSRRVPRSRALSANVAKPVTKRLLSNPNASQYPEVGLPKCDSVQPKLSQVLSAAQGHDPSRPIPQWIQPDAPGIR